MSNSIQKVYNRTNDISLAYKEYDHLRYMAKVKAIIALIGIQLILSFRGVHIMGVLLTGVFSGLFVWWYCDTKALSYIKALRTNNLSIKTDSYLFLDIFNDKKDTSVNG